MSEMYFASPEEAVPIISGLLGKKDFKILARYYDLSESEIKLSELESGDFFIRKERPEVTHPADLWHYKHPFAPGFTFSHVRSTPQDAVYMVEVSITIEQGLDRPEQVGLSYFYMVNSEKGWKVLPDQVPDEAHYIEMPKTTQELDIEI